jgi:recombination protein RecT
MQNLNDMQANQKAGTNALANVANHPVLGKTTYLDKRKDLLGAGIPGHMTVEREIRTATVMLMQSRDLQQASPESFYVAVSVAVNSGIGLGNGKGYLIPYKGNVSFVPGWKGLVDLVSRTGRASCWTGVVHKGDDFDYALGDSPYLKHKPGDNEDHKDVTHYYAIGRIKGSDWPVVVVWSAAKVVKHLNQFNKVGARHYALKDDNNFEQYGRKVVLLQALKFLPTSQDLESAMNAEIAHESGKGVTLEGNFVYVNDADDEPAQDVAETIPRTDADLVEVKIEKNEPVRQPIDKEAMTDDVRTTYESVAAQLQKAGNLDSLSVAADLIQTVGHAGLRAELTTMYKRYLEELSNPAPAAKEEKAGEAAPAKRTRRGSGAAPE